jgi:hypothetical protein
MENDLLPLLAVDRAVRGYRGELKVREFLLCQSISRPRARAALESLRDHIDCSIPYVHELIAFLARMDYDLAAKTAAVDRLKEFGPEFADWESKWGWNGPSMAEAMAQVMSEALFGLTKSFGISLQVKLSKS